MENKKMLKTEGLKKVYIKTCGIQLTWYLE